MTGQASLRPVVTTGHRAPFSMPGVKLCLRWGCLARICCVGPVHVWTSVPWRLTSVLATVLRDSVA